jgi:hypothetical protein
MKPSYLLLAYPCLHTYLGQCEAPNSWNIWRGACAGCHQLIFTGQGICCSNLSSMRGPWTACHSVWCGICYVLTKADRHPIKELVTEDGEDVVRHLKDQKKWRQGRNRENLICPFQCDLCQFRNIKQMDPWKNDLNDNNLLQGIHRANLDAF